MRVSCDLFPALAIVMTIFFSPASLSAQATGPAATAPGQMRIKLSGSDPAISIATRVEPKYPDEARRQHIEGQVILHAVIGVDGAVKDVTVISGPQELSPSALEAVKQWRYKQTLINGQPVEIDTTIALIYALHPTPAVTVDKNYKPAPPLNVSDTPGSVLASKGTIEGGTYKNSAIGLEFTPAPGLRLEQMPGVGSKGIAVQAQTDPGPQYGLTVFYAEDLAYYPEDQRNASRYREKIVRANEEGRFQLTEGEPSAEISGIPFVRADFVRGAVHETVLVMTHNGYAFVLIFTGASAERTGKLIASTSLKVAP